jgi:polysaccharide export outer membrane protein
MRDPKGLFLAQRFPLFARDVLYVTNSPSTDLQKALQVFSLISGPALTGAALAR